MSAITRLEYLLELLADAFYAVLPSVEPDLEAVRHCKIVSHRGEHGRREIKENTLAAFDVVFQHGVWGIEFDIRWTRDLHPVVIHDPDCERVFGEGLMINQVSLAELHSKIPQIPTLAQVIDAYGGKIHLMVEIKEEPFFDIQYQRESLQKLFSRLTPKKDFHILALNPEVFRLVDFIPQNALLPVAEFNVREISEIALREKYAGVGGHYLLLGGRLLRRLKAVDQKIGTGFISSRRCFYRELNRNVTWVFTNHAVKLRNIRQELLKRLSVD